MTPILTLSPLAVEALRLTDWSCRICRRAYASERVPPLEICERCDEDREERERAESRARYDGDSSEED